MITQEERSFFYDPFTKQTNHLLVLMSSGRYNKYVCSFRCLDSVPLIKFFEVAGAGGPLEDEEEAYNKTALRPIYNLRDRVRPYTDLPR